MSDALSGSEFDVQILSEKRSWLTESRRSRLRCAHFALGSPLGCLAAAPRPVTEGDRHRDGGRGRDRSWFAWLRGFPGQRERGGVAAVHSSRFNKYNRKKRKLARFGDVDDARSAVGRSEAGRGSGDVGALDLGIGGIRDGCAAKILGSEYSLQARRS